MNIFPSFFIFGLVNNVLYVLILSAAVDLVGSLPKGIVLLADVVPGFLIKLTAPFWIHKIPYQHRILALVALSSAGMLLIAIAEQLEVRLLGVICASASSGLGEISFLQLTHYYEKASINGFSSGTGAAGLVGAMVYLVFTTWLRFNPRTVMLLFALAPALFPIVFNKLPGSLPREAPRVAASTSSTMAKIRPLILRFIVPLTSVYISEYIINQGVAPTLLFDRSDMPFREYRDAYVAYGTLYQIGVFISRSSAPFYRIRQLYIPAVLQLLNLALCILQSVYFVVPIWWLFVLMIYEGLLGGAAYVNTYMLVSETVVHTDREFSMGAVGVSDSAGVVMAGLISLWLEPKLCGYQVAQGRDWCRL